MNFPIELPNTDRLEVSNNKLQSLKPDAVAKEFQTMASGRNVKGSVDEVVVDPTPPKQVSFINLSEK